MVWAICEDSIVANDYDSVFNTVESALTYLLGTKYEYELYAIRQKALDLWRLECDQPMGLVWSEVNKNDKGAPEATLCFRNLSDKKIIAFKVTFTCYDVFGNVKQSNYDYYYDDEADMDVFESIVDTWELKGMDGVITIGNIQVTEVVFNDGTKWTRDWNVYSSVYYR